MSACSGRGDASGWLKPPALAKRLGMSTDWVQTQVTRHLIPHHRIGQPGGTRFVTRFCPECVERITRATYVAPADQPRLRQPA